MTRSYPLSALAAAAVCCLAPLTAQAQATVYGLLDLSVGQFQDSGTTKSKRVDSGNMATSFLGFQGSEPVSGTLKAKFAIETFMRADTGASGRFTGDTFWARSAYVGLQGDFGSTTLGRNTTAFFISTLLFTPFGDSFGFSPSIRQTYRGTLLGDSGWSNSISYASNDMGGATFMLQGALGESASLGNNVGSHVLYFSGPFAGTAAYQKVKSVAGTSQDAFNLGASYDLKVAKLFGQLTQIKTDTGTDVKHTAVEIGVSAPVGPGKLLAQYGMLKNKTTDVSNKTLTVGYDYDLSKRTDVYAVLMNDKTTNLSAGNTVAAGLRLKF